MDEITKIRQILKDLTPFEPRSNDYCKYVSILTGIYNPPSYMVEILLLAILGFEDYGRMEKVLWHTYFHYKNCAFMIRDYKFGSWTIEGTGKDERVLRLAEAIRDKVIKASKVLDRALHSILKARLEKEKFYLKNVYHKLSSIYEFYEKKVLGALKKDKKFEEDKKKVKGIPDILRIINTRSARMKVISEMISNYTFALILSFFSLLEFLLDVIYAFEQPNKKFFEFRKERLDDRFKLLFPINKNKKLKHFYDEFLNIKTNYRNPLAHGLTSEVNLLVPLSRTRLVPLSYEYLSDSPHYGFVEIEQEDAVKIMGTFTRFLKFMKNEEPYRFYMLYVTFSFPIPIESKEISEIKKRMTTYRYFKKYLIDRGIYESMLINRDI